jgi:CheY-like chemotaxis protein
MARILVIDDDPAMLRLIQRVLTRAGHEVELAKDGVEGLTLFSTGEFSVVVTDVLMPNQDGIETIRELRRQAPEIKIIAVSGGGIANTAIFLKIARDLGADSILAKPFQLDDLLQLVGTATAQD